MEWMAAAAACLYAAFVSQIIMAIRYHSSSFTQAPDKLPQTYTSRQWLALGLGLTLVVCFLSIPSVVYVIAMVMPSNSSTLGFSSTVLKFSRMSIGVILSLDASMAIPLLATQATKQLTGGVPDQRLGFHLVTLTQLMVTLIVPFCMVLLLGQQCFGNWLRYWMKCDTSTSFDIFVSGYADPKANIQIVRHDEICYPQYDSRRCPREIVEVLGKMITRKLVSCAFIVPSVLLMRVTEKGRRLEGWVMRKVLRMSNYKVEINANNQLAYAASLVEFPLVLGFVMPFISLLATISMAQIAGVLQFAKHLGAPISEIGVSPSTISQYLWLCAVLGYLLVCWVFAACGLQGVSLVLFGMPVSAACSTIVFARWRNHNTQHIPDSLAHLRSPLVELQNDQELQDVQGLGTN